MVNFFKSFGRGILYVLVLPLLLVVLAVYAVVSLFIFLYMCIKGLVLFFTGRSLFDDLPEDKKAKELLKAKEPQPQEETPAMDNGPVLSNNVSFNPQPSANPASFDNPDPVSDDPFYIPEYLKPKADTDEKEEGTDNFDDEGDSSFEYSSDFDDMRKEDSSHYEGVSIDDELEEEDDDE